MILLMRTVYLIGGGPGTGKTTIAQKLGERYNLQYFKADAFVNEHQPAAAAQEYPMNSFLETVPEAERPLELIRFTAKQELARQSELFFMFAKELEDHEYDQAIIEGNCLLPELVSTQLDTQVYRSVWLIPTPPFQAQIYPNRDWAKELLAQADDPDLTLQQWLQRDAEYNEAVKSQAKTHNLPFLVVDGKRSIEYTYAWVEQQLGLGKLAPAASPRT